MKTSIALGIACGFVALGAPRSLGAQLSGVVVSEGGEPVPYVLLTLQPRARSQFTDVHGRFAFLAVEPGQYQLGLRQVGYFPVDTALSIGGPATLNLVMRPLPVNLAPIVVAGRGGCIEPGLPDSIADPRAFALLEQLRISAERFVFLSDSFPFEFEVSRTFTDSNAAGRQLQTMADTIQYRSDIRPPYRPGQVISSGKGAGGGYRLYRLPTLAEFADPSFIFNHCWTAGGPQADTVIYAALSFAPPASLRTSDVEGTFYLDVRSMQLDRAELRLTHVQQVLPEGSTVHATVHFQAMFPGMVVPSGIIGRARAARRSGRYQASVTSEHQRLLRLRLLNPSVLPPPPPLNPVR